MNSFSFFSSELIVHRILILSIVVNKIFFKKNYYYYCYYYYYYCYCYYHCYEKKRKYNYRVTELEQGTFTPLVFTTTGGMAVECLRYHSRLAELLSAKKQEIRATPQQFHGSGRKCPLQFCGARSYA